MMSAFWLAEAIDREDDVVAGIILWKRRAQRLIAWVQRVAYWYGQLALLPPAARSAAFRALGASDALTRVTLLVGASHDPTAADYWPIDLDPGFPFVIPLVH